jgi:hypothetical protein
VFLDVGLDFVLLLEGALPGDRAGAAGDEQGAVDVPEDGLDLALAAQCSLSSRSR